MIARVPFYLCKQVQVWGKGKRLCHRVAGGGGCTIPLGRMSQLGQGSEHLVTLRDWALSRR